MAQSPFQKLNSGNSSQKTSKSKHQTFLALCSFNEFLYFIPNILSGIVVSATNILPIFQVFFVVKLKLLRKSVDFLLMRVTLCLGATDVMSLQVVNPFSVFCSPLLEKSEDQLFLLDIYFSCKKSCY